MAIAAGGLVVVIILIVVLVRNRGSDSIDMQNLARLDAQLEQSLADCAQEADPDACRERKVQLAAEAVGTADVCQSLADEAYDECVWTVARTQENVATCLDMQDVGKAVTCADAIFLKLALANVSAETCDSIQDEQKKTDCLAAVAGPLTQENCLERKDAAFCSEFDLFVRATVAQDPDICDEITDADISAMCVEVVAPGDRDFDGLDEGEESAYGTSDRSSDTDNDGFADREEVDSGYNPNGTGRL